MSVPEVPASLRSWMSAVSEIVRSVNAAEPLASVLTRVADQACELIGFEFCAVMLADERRERMARCRSAPLFVLRGTLRMTRSSSFIEAH